MEDVSIHMGKLSPGLEEKKEVNNAIDANKVLQLKLIEQKNESILANRLVSCCGSSVDRRLLLILINFFITIIVITFCIVELFISETCEDKNSYMSLMTFIIGYWLSAAIN